MKNMNSLLMAQREMRQCKNVALCLYYNSDKGGLQIEVRNIDDGELVSQPIVIADKLQNDSPFDLVDQMCTRVLNKVRQIRTGLKPFRG